MIAGLAVSIGLACASHAAAPTVFALTVKDANGVPVRDAVVTVYPAGGASGLAPGAFGPLRMAQQNLTFAPDTLVVPVGGEVGFPNRDKVRHHVYSFSKAARFELKLYGREESRSQKFMIAGSVALGCNIHDQMKGYLKVVDTPFAAKTDEYGNVRLAGLPAGEVSVRVWHPLHRAKDNESRYSIPIAAGGTTAKDLVFAIKAR